MALDRKSSQEYPFNAGVSQGSIPCFYTFPTLRIIELPDDVICNITIYADDATLYSKCDQAFNLCQQRVLASKLESDLRNTVEWGRSWLADFSAGKTQLVLIDQSNNTGTIGMKIDESVLEEKSSSKMVGLSFSSKLDWGSYIISITISASEKIGALIIR